MSSSKLKIVFAAIALALILLLITNPSSSDFKSFSNDFEQPKTEAKVYRQTVRKKVANYWIYSIYILRDYEYRRYSGERLIKQEKYIGILSNFYLVN